LQIGEYPIKTLDCRKRLRVWKKGKTAPAAEEAAAIVTNLEVEIRHLRLLLAAEKAATAAKVHVPGY